VVNDSLSQHLLDTGQGLADGEERKGASELRVSATVAAPEQGIAEVHVRTPGFVERISVRGTGVRVQAGSELFAMYSPEVFQGQAELLAARGFGNGGQAVAGIRQKLELLGMAPSTIDEVIRLALERMPEPIEWTPEKIDKPQTPAPVPPAPTATTGLPGMTRCTRQMRLNARQFAREILSRRVAAVGILGETPLEEPLKRRRSIRFDRVDRPGVFADERRGSFGAGGAGLPDELGKKTRGGPSNRWLHARSSCRTPPNGSASSTCRNTVRGSTRSRSCSGSSTGSSCGAETSRR